MTDDLLVPLSVLALDTGTTAAALAHRLADQVLVDDLGRLAIDRDRARELIVEHQRAQAAWAAAQRDRDQAHRAGIAAQSDALHERVKAIQNQQAAMYANGSIAADTPALAVMCGSDKQTALDVAGYRTEQYLKGRSFGARISPTTKGQ